jgi:hypothetical protein
VLSHGLSHCKEAEIPSSPDRVSGQSRQPDRNSAAGSGSRRNKITFGCSALTALAQTLVEIDLATESDWIAAGKLPAALVDSVFRRFLRDHGQEIIAEHFELSLTLGESIVDTGTPIPEPIPGHSFSFSTPSHPLPWALGRDDRTGGCHPGMGVAFYDTLRKPSTAGSGSMTIWTPGTASSK